MIPEEILLATWASWRAKASRCFCNAPRSCWLIFSFSPASCHSTRLLRSSVSKDAMPTRQEFSSEYYLREQDAVKAVEHKL
jgi:hypothetical protein